MKNLICFVSIMLITLSAYATTLVVDQFNGPYYTINAAYNDAVDDDTILIYPATYLESVDISKAITLEGVDPNSTIIQSNNDYAVKINNGNVTISNLKIICTHEGIEVHASSPIIKHCIVENSDKGIFVFTQTTNIQNCVIKDCSVGLRYNHSSTGKSLNNLIYNCTSYGIEIYTDAWSPGQVDFFNNIIINCNYGFGTTYYCHYDGDLAYNCFYNNSTNTSGANLGPGNIFDINPLLTDYENGNYYLHSDSPCIDTGIPGVEYEDLDGTRNDMGIFGGPTEWSMGKPTVLDVQINPESVLPGETFDIEATSQIK